jgi:hypothetical protein
MASLIGACGEHTFTNHKYLSRFHVSAKRDAQFAHAVPQCPRIQPQEFGSASWAFDFPIGHLEYVADMSAHHLTQRERLILSHSNVFQDGMWGSIEVSKREWFPLAENQRTLHLDQRGNIATSFSKGRDIVYRFSGHTRREKGY